MSDFIQFLTNCAIDILGPRKPWPKWQKTAVLGVVFAVALALIVTAFLQATALKSVPFSELHQRPSAGAFEIKGPTP
ncbi:MAG: hypothetical protein JSR91_01790 [Proteobacteria bacterium]|nr:hypothetical protein [Pseudomonadota bacterium]